VPRDNLDHYFADRAGYSILAERSVTYLYTPKLLEPILRLWPNSRFVIALRDPMQMVPSLHQRLRYMGDETASEFEHAWSLVRQRRQGRAVPRGCADPRWLDYWESGRLGHYVSEIFRTVGPERCFISLFDDLVADPAAQYRRMLEFLELPDDHQCEFRPERESSGFRIPWLQRLLKRPPPAALKFFGSAEHQHRVAKPVRRGHTLASSAILGARKRVLRWNRRAAPPVRLSPAVQGQIRAMFHEDVRLLEDTISRDLSHWLQPQAAGESR
jgi:hypothetical protein